MRGLIVLLLLAGAGRLVAQQQFVDETAGRLPTLEDRSVGAAFADLDGDGKPDLYVVNGLYPDTYNRVLINDGAGHFSDEAALRADSLLEDSFGAVWGDIDADGDLDLFVANFGDTSRLYINNGAGFLREDGASRLPVRGDYHSSAAAWGDLDGDGSIDLLVSNGGAEPDFLFLNDGTGILHDGSSRIPSAPGDRSAVDVADIDGDYDLDAVVLGGWWRRPNQLLMNDGAGHFVDEAATRLPTKLLAEEGAAFGDVDRDGDLDLVTATSYSD